MRNCLKIIPWSKLNSLAAKCLVDLKVVFSIQIFGDFCIVFQRKYVKGFPNFKNILTILEKNTLKENWYFKNKVKESNSKSLTHGQRKNNSFGHIYVICRLIWTFLTVLPRICQRSHLWWLDEWESWASVVLLTLISFMIKYKK